MLSYASSNDIPDISFNPNQVQTIQQIIGDLTKVSQEKQSQEQAIKASQEAEARQILNANPINLPKPIVNQHVTKTGWGLSEKEIEEKKKGEQMMALLNQQKPKAAVGEIIEIDDSPPSTPIERISPSPHANIPSRTTPSPILPNNENSVEFPKTSSLDRVFSNSPTDRLKAPSPRQNEDYSKLFSRPEPEISSPQQDYATSTSTLVNNLPPGPASIPAPNFGVSTNNFPLSTGGYSNRLQNSIPTQKISSHFDDFRQNKQQQQQSQQPDRPIASSKLKDYKALNKQNFNNNNNSNNPIDTNKSNSNQKISTHDTHSSHNPSQRENSSNLRDSQHNYQKTDNSNHRDNRENSRDNFRDRDRDSSREKVGNSSRDRNSNRGEHRDRDRDNREARDRDQRNRNNNDKDNYRRDYRDRDNRDNRDNRNHKDSRDSYRDRRRDHDRDDRNRKRGHDSYSRNDNRYKDDGRRRDHRR